LVTAVKGFSTTMPAVTQLRTGDPILSSCALIDRCRHVLCDNDAQDQPNWGSFLRNVQETLCREARGLGTVGTYICGTADEDALVWSRESSEMFSLQGRLDPCVGCYFERVHADDVVALRRARRESVEQARSYDVRYRIVLPSGKTRWIHERGAAVESEDGTGHRLAGVLQDVTEQQESELVLRALLNETEEQLCHAQRMEALGRLASGVAHDFNNLLSVIMAAVELALGSVDAGESPRQDLEEIHKAGVRGSLLTRQLLAFSRRDATRLQVLDVCSLVEGMQSLLERVLGEDVALGMAVAGSALRVRADPGMLEQVLMNLAVNARDAMPDGGQLSVEVGETIGEACDGKPGTGPKVWIKVTDSGTGMDSVTRARVFEPFFTTKQAGRGTGLGLSTVAGIVKQCGGSVTVESELGAGTAFTIVLPRVAAEIEVEAPAPSIRRPTGTETILLVEDDEQVRAVAGAVLRQSGYTVLEASNGEQALARLASDSTAIQLLVTDVVMPVMGGCELVRRLRLAVPTLKVLLISGYEGSDAAEACAATPGTLVLSKPFSAGALGQTVRRALDRADWPASSGSALAHA
jgi:signal transduction histidine kinase/ActR/RegA family two-component response regulator